MNSRSEQSQSDLFLVRVWPAQGAQEMRDHEAAWHGRVQHVLTGEAHSFENLNILVSKLEGMMHGSAAAHAGNESSA